VVKKQGPQGLKRSLGVEGFSCLVAVLFLKICHLLSMKHNLRSSCFASFAVHFAELCVKQETCEAGH
jgi:hypothetical protein